MAVSREPARDTGLFGTELAKHAPPHAVDAALDAYRYEGRRLTARERAVELVERALRAAPHVPVDG